MLTPEGSIRLCANCPNREWEGTSDFEPVTGDLVDREARYVNARFEFVRSPDETPDVLTQEMGARFVDTGGNKTTAFLPGVELNDIADCESPVTTRQSGFLARKKHYDCGAQATKLAALRQRMER